MVCFCLLLCYSTGGFLLHLDFSGVVSHSRGLLVSQYVFFCRVLISDSVGAELSLVSCLAIRGSTGGFLLLSEFSGGISQTRDLRCRNTLFLSSPRL